MDKALYVELLDTKNKGMIIRRVRTKSYVYKSNNWFRTARMTDYLWPDSPKFGMYREISEAEAFKRLNIDK